MARISLNDAMARPAAVDREKLDATTEEDIGRYRAEDGFADAEVPADARTVVPPRELRVGLGLTQREMAARLRVPFDTWRNWETGRVSLDPAVRSLLDLVAAFGERAFAALAQKKEPALVDRALRALAAEGFTFTPGAPALGDDAETIVSLPDTAARTGVRRYAVMRTATTDEDGLMSYGLTIGDAIAVHLPDAKTRPARSPSAGRRKVKAT